MDHSLPPTLLLAEVLETFSLPFPPEGAGELAPTPAERLEQWEVFLNLPEHSRSPIVTALVAYLEREGHFQEPVALWTGDSEDPAQVLNGLHRLTAHHLTGVEPVRVLFKTPEDPPLEREEEAVEVLLVLEVVTPGDSAPSLAALQKLREEATGFEDLFEFTSLRVEGTPRTVWIEREFATGFFEAGVGYRESYFLVGAHPQEDSLEVLSSALLSHLQAWGALLPGSEASVRWEAYDSEGEPLEELPW